MGRLRAARGHALREFKVVFTLVLRQSVRIDMRAAPLAPDQHRAWPHIRTLVVVVH